MAWQGSLHGYRSYADTEALGTALSALVAQGADQLPLPGSGCTLERFRALAIVAGHDLRLCKLFEGHTDALAIMAELDSPSPPRGSTWGTWAAEPPTAKVHVQHDGHRLRVHGRKAWCSGAAVVSHGLLTAWDEQGRQQLVAVPMQQPGVSVTHEGWHAVGMAATGSVEVIFDNAGAPPQRSMASVRARRTRTSSNGFFLWFGVPIRPQFQSLSCTVILSPSALTNSSRAEGGSPRNSIAARSLRIASSRVACFGARMPTILSR